MCDFELVLVRGKIVGKEKLCLEFDKIGIPNEPKNGTFAL